MEPAGLGLPVLQPLALLLASAVLLEPELPRLRLRSQLPREPGSVLAVHECQIVVARREDLNTILKG